MGSGCERNEFIYVRERVKKNKGRDVKQCARIASHSIYYYVIYSHVAYIVPRVDNIYIYVYMHPRGGPVHYIMYI